MYLTGRMFGQRRCDAAVVSLMNQSDFMKRVCSRGFSDRFVSVMSLEPVVLCAVVFIQHGHVFSDVE